MKEFDFGVNFHQTFPPNPAYIGRILSIASGDPLTAREISERTGIPQGESSGKVVPHLKYSAYMGLIEPEINVPTLTLLGKTILEEDFSCSEELSQWLLHIRLTSKSGAPMWHYFVRKLLLENKGRVSKEFLSTKMQDTFGTTKYTPVLTTYNELSSIEYLNQEKASEYVQVLPKRIQREYLFAYAYAMLHEWDLFFPDTKEITADLLQKLACTTCFGLTEDQWFEVLERLQERNICRINKQLSPYTILRLSDTQSMIPKLFSLLI